MCNLPDHPVHAGCTSVVAVVVGRTLVVANAGDSRAVLCRAGGLTEPLSFDHKPLQVSIFSCLKKLCCNYLGGSLFLSLLLSWFLIAISVSNNALFQQFIVTILVRN